MEMYKGADMRNKNLVKCLCSLAIAVTGFVFAFLLFIVSLKIDQLYVLKMEEAIAAHTDLAANRPLAVLVIAVELVTGIPYVISLFAVGRILKNKEYPIKDRRIVTIIGSALFMLLMIFLFNVLAGLDMMYPLIPSREMAYDIMIMLVQFFTCFPAGIVLLISIISLLIRRRKE